VLLSSHLMSELQLVADHVLIIGQGRILADTSKHDFIEHSSGGDGVAVASPDAGALAPLLAAPQGSSAATSARVLAAAVAARPLSVRRSHQRRCLGVRASRSTAAAGRSTGLAESMYQRRSQPLYEPNVSAPSGTVET
jgi:ABC-type multidrug transport system ATPase subunit